MPAQHTDFNYLSLLRLLERSIVPRGESQAFRGVASPDIIGKGVKVAKELRRTLVAALGKLAKSRRSERQLKANLDLKCERLRKHEEILIRNIEECAQGLRPKQSYKLAGWPPLVPAESMVAHFAAHAIGLQSENPECRLAENVRATWLEVVAPALAWGILAQLQDADPTPEDRKRIADRIRNGAHAEPRFPEQTSDLPYLRFAEAWLEVLQGDEPWQLPLPDIQALRDELAKLIVEANIRKLWATLGGHFSHVAGGSERAKAVQLASRRLPDQPKAAFLRDRLVLLESSRHPAVQELAKESRRNPAKAVEIAKAWLAEVCPAKAKDEPLSPDQCTIACGMAYWLAHMLFKAHDRPEVTALNEASDLVCHLLTQGEKDAESPHQRLLCLRYRAGYASNPRYHRSLGTIQQAGAYVRAYMETTGHHRDLVQLFWGRLNWQIYLCDRKICADARLEANSNYAQALKGLESSGMDSEAPIHIFPELMVLFEEQLSPRKPDKVPHNHESLDLLDYLAQRAYGVYFDAPTERAAIQAGCDQYKSTPLLESQTDKINRINAAYAEGRQFDAEARREERRDQEQGVTRDLSTGRKILTPYEIMYQKMLQAGHGSKGRKKDSDPADKSGDQ